MSRDFGQGKTQSLSDHCKRKSPEVRSSVAAVPALIAQRLHDAMRLVKPDGRNGEAGPLGKLTNSNAMTHGKFLVDLKLTLEITQEIIEGKPGRNVPGQEQMEVEMARLEHVNITVADPDASAEVLCGLFGWKIRWSGPGMTTGRTVHVGEESTYLALFTYGNPEELRQESYLTRGGLNHIAVVVDDLDATEARVKAAGYLPGEVYDYEPGRRFYFVEANGIEIEVVEYR